MKKKVAGWISIFLITLTTGLMVGCEEKGPMEKAGEAIDDAAEDVADKAEDVVDKVD